MPGEAGMLEAGMLIAGRRLLARLAAAARSRPRLAICVAVGAVMIAALVLVVTLGRASPVAQIGAFSDPMGFTPEFVAFSPDGKTIAASFDDGVSSEVSSNIFTWTPGSRSPALLASTLGSNAYGLAFSPASANALAYDENGDSGIELWNVAKHTKTAYKDPGNAAQFHGFASAQAGTTLAEVDPNGSVYLLDTANGTWLARHFTPPAALLPISPADEISLSPDGQTMAVLDAAKNLYVWNLSGAGDQPTVITGAGDALFSPDSKTLAIVYPGRVRLWDVTTRAFSSVQLPGPSPQDGNNQAQDAMAFSANGATLAVAYGYHNFDDVYLWSLTARTAVTFRAPATGRGGLALSPDGDTLALAGDTGSKVYVYRVSH